MRRIYVSLLETPKTGFVVTSPKYITDNENTFFFFILLSRLSSKNAYNWSNQIVGRAVL